MSCGQVIIDLDGTLVDTSQAMGLQGDWEAYNEAILRCPANKPLTDLARRLQVNFDLVIFCTRPASDYWITLDWLSQQGIVPEALLHRPDHNFAPELELFRFLHAHALDPGQMLDDLAFAVTAKPKLAELWRGMGITTLEAVPLVAVA